MTFKTDQWFCIFSLSWIPEYQPKPNKTKMKTKQFKFNFFVVAALLILLSSCAEQEKVIIKDGADRLAAWETHLNMEENSSFNSLKWQFIGPKNTSGRMTDVAISPDRDFILTASASGGVWKSTNEGDSWVSIFEKEISSSIGDIAIAPSDKSIIWIFIY